MPPPQNKQGFPAMSRTTRQFMVVRNVTCVQLDRQCVIVDERLMENSEAASTTIVLPSSGTVLVQEPTLLRH